MTSDKLAKENKDLKRSLRLLISKAERNEAILHNFFNIELRLLSCIKLADLLNLILIDFKNVFHITSVNLILFDPEKAARDLLEQYIPPRPNGSLRFVKNQRLLKSIYPNNTMIVGTPSKTLLDEAFPNTDIPVKSCALMPLTRQNFLIGSLHLGSNDIGRYTEHVRYDYIQHLASVIAVCLENCIHHENLQRVSSIDMLTKVLNRRSFEHEIVREIFRAERHSTPLACLFLDLDHFKLINDNFGHQTGDMVLRNFGKFLKKYLRKTDIVARYGGEEFAILLPNCNQQRAIKVAETLRKNLADRIFRTEQGLAFKVSTSIGASVFTSANTNLKEPDVISHYLLQAADKAVYTSKSNGRDQVTFLAFEKALALKNN